MQFVVENATEKVHCTNLVCKATLNEVCDIVLHEWLLLH